MAHSDAQGKLLVFGKEFTREVRDQLRRGNMQILPVGDATPKTDFEESFRR